MDNAHFLKNLILIFFSNFLIQSNLEMIYHIRLIQTYVNANAYGTSPISWFVTPFLESMLLKNVYHKPNMFQSTQAYSARI
jgi:hypothetical protein